MIKYYILYFVSNLWITSLYYCSVDALEPFSVSRINQRAKEIEQLRSATTNADTQEDHPVTGKTTTTATATSSDGIDDVQELYLTQRLDHFSSSPSHSASDTHDDDSMHTFSQRYFYTPRYLVAGQSFASSPSTTTISSSSSVTVTDKIRRRLGHPRNATDYDVHISNNHKDNNNYYYNNNKDSSNNNTYVFICLGGEGPYLTPNVLTNSTHCSGDMLSLARILSTELHARVHVFALEHRYYGKSYPVFPSSSELSSSSSSPVTTEHLKYLSSRQALADLAYFISYIQNTYEDITPTTKIVTFGGSYPGMLAAWSRLKYPHLIHAAVSNSAPLEVVLDFGKYKEVYSRSLSNPTVGGSSRCVDVIRQAHSDAEALIMGGKEEDLRYVADLFHLCNGTVELKEKKSVDAFLGDGMVFLDVQGNDPACQEDLCNIEKFCRNITQEADAMVPPLEILAKISRAMEEGEEDDRSDDNDKDTGNQKCKDISWENMIAFLSSPKDAQVDGIRSWLWQTCTEVGFYQTCEVDSECPFGRGHHTLDADLEICQRVFGIDPEWVNENVQETLRTYGGWNISSDQILSVNGDIDPWSIQSLSAAGRTDDEDRLPTYWSMGASHHFWTHEVKGTDGFGIMRTRDIIYNWVISLLQVVQDHHY